MGSQKGSAGISQREFARRDGCSEKRVRMGLTTGHLKKLPNGKLDPAQVGTAWRKRNRQPADSAETSAKQKSDQKSAIDDASLQEQAAEQLEALQSADELWDMATAERIKENYLALLRKLEYDIKSRAVVPAEEVLSLVGSEYAKVRTRLLSLPSELASRLVLMRTAPEIQAAIEEAVNEALEELTGDNSNAHA